MHNKDIAKFLSGFVFCCFLFHVVLAVGGVLPIHIFGMEVTESANKIAIIMSGLLTVIFNYYAFFKKN